jgi:tRNA G18 (ribose-2'-O)-methylase SpoU
MFRKLVNDELGRISVEEFKTAPKEDVIVILDNVRSQHNIGSALRSCDAFRVSRIFLCGICAVPPSAQIHKAALGAEFSMDWEYCESTMDVVERLRSQGYVIVSVEQAENSTSLGDFRREDDRKYALIFGNEVHGVAQEVVSASDVCLEIPQYGTKHSLNVSVSIGIVLWELLGGRTVV